MFDAALASWVGRAAVDVHLLRRPAAARWRSSTTATSTRATTSSSRSTCWATSSRCTCCSSSRPSSSGSSASPSATRCRGTAASARCASPVTASVPKNRFITTPDGEPGLNYLCAGYKAFFTHIDRPMRMMAESASPGTVRGRGDGDPAVAVKKTSASARFLHAPRASRSFGARSSCRPGSQRWRCSRRPCARRSQWCLV